MKKKKKEKRFCSSIFESLKDCKVKEKIRQDLYQEHQTQGYLNDVYGFETEENCMLSFLRKGFKVSKPVLSNSPYDLVVDIDNKLYKIQVKASSWIDEKDKIFGFKTCASGSRRKYTKDTVDYFMTSFEGKEYLIPFDNVNNKTFKLSLNKESSVYADQYLFE